jgi:PAS domain S-box-containing protein
MEVFPAYAEFILTNHLDKFVTYLYKLAVELDTPLLKFFEGLPEKELLKMSREGNVLFLTSIKTGAISDYIEYSRNNWLRNQLPIISREDVIVEDIALVNYARRKAFREILPSYTSDQHLMLRILDEVDRFLLSLDSSLYKTYISIQQEKLTVSNSQLRKREQELLEAQALAKIGSFEWDLTGNQKSQFTPEVYKIFELDETSKLEVFLNDVHPDDRLKLQAAIEKSMHDGIYECEYRYNRRNKHKILYSRGRVLFDGGRAIKMIGTVTDVTEKATLIKTLTESQEISQQAQSLTNTGSWKWTVDSDKIEWSDEMYRIYGLDPQSEAITFQRFLTFIHDDDRNKRIAEITDAIKTGKASDYVMRIVAKDGKLKVLKGKGQVIVDKTQKAIGILGTCQDITIEHQLTTELKQKNDELSRKNRDLESFNFIASHDLQEPLRKIQLYSNRIISEGVDEIPESLLRHFQKIAQASNRMQKMIEDFLTFYHSLGKPAEEDDVDISKLVHEAVLLLKPMIDSKRGTIEVGHLPVISVKRSQILQVIKHLISNAIKFSKTEVQPAVKIYSSSINKGNQQFAVISITDNGIGFDQKYADRIFELFQRLHSTDEYTGTGIGLSLCKKIIEDHNGWITVASEEGVGSTFNIHLPLRNGK